MAGKGRLRAACGALCAVALVLAVAPGAAATAPPSFATARIARLGQRVPAGATHLGRLADAQRLTFDVVLAPSHADQIETLLAAQRDPSSPQYGRYLAPGEFARRFGPTAQQVASTTSWLHARGLVDTSVNGFSVTVRTTAGAAARALGISMERYRTADHRDAFVAEGAPLVPPEIAGSISSLVGLSSVPAARPMLQPRPRAHGSARAAIAPRATSGALAAPSACAGARAAAGTTFWTPDRVGGMYGVGNLLAAGQNGGGKTIAVVELAPHSPTDTSAYLSCFGLTNQVVTRTVSPPPGPDALGTLEANIDIEEAATQSPRATIMSYEGENSDAGEYAVYRQIVNDDVAQVVSVSWGMCEAAVTTGAASMDGLHTLFLQAAAQGQTVVAASGDTGSEDCFALGSAGLAVDSPASDPLVTAVGGTTLTAPGTEPVWNDCEAEPSYAQCRADLGGDGGAGGGGVSQHFGRPSWQSPKPGVCTTCRQVPDVSANAGTGEIFRSSGGWVPVGGTSIAAPKIAGIVANVDTACTAPLGQLAPRLAALTAGDPQHGYGVSINDVTVGDNDLTRNHGGLYPATVGPDLATGLGVPIAGGWSCPQVTAIDTSTGDAGATLTVGGFNLTDTVIYFGTTRAQVQSRTATSAVVTVPAGTGTVAVYGVNAMGVGIAWKAFTYAGTDPTPPVGVPTTTPPHRPSALSTPAQGYRTVATDGGIFDFGGARFYGSTGNIHLNQPIVGLANDLTTGGYWFVARDGGIFAFHAPFYGSTAGLGLTSPVVGMAATPQGDGYWVVTADGSVFAFGHARAHGSAPPSGASVVGIAATNDGAGYWLATSDGQVYAFGDAHGYGSMAGTPLSRPIVGIATDTATGGYWLVATDGGIFGFHAPFYGSTGNIHLNQPIVGISPTASGKGYWLVARDGGIFSFGDARFAGSMGGSHLNQPMVGIATAR